LKWEAVDLDAASLVIRSSLAATRVKKKDRGEASGVITKGTKSGKARTVPLDEYGVATFRSIRASQAADRLRHAAAYRDDGFAFTDAIGRPLKLDAPTKAFHDIASVASLPAGLTLHSLRHTFASWSLAGGRDIASVQHVLGHSVPSTTLNLYSHAVEGGREQAVRAASETLQRVKARRAVGEN
jgi:integrase